MKLPFVSEKKAKEDFDIKNGIKFSALIELLGSPKKHLEDTMNAFIDNIKKNKEYKLLNTEVSKVKEVEKEGDEKEIFSTFAELEIGVKQKSDLFDFCFNFMPSSIEIIEPMNVTFTSNEISQYLTDIQGTLHRVDAALKDMNAANNILKKHNVTLNQNMLQMLQNNIVLSLREKDKTLEELSKSVGIKEEQFRPFIDKLVESKAVKLKSKKYSLIKK